MRVLAIDYGTKRVGLAISDELKLLATPFRVMPTDGKLVEELARIIGENNVGQVLLGMPYRDGEETPTTAKVRAFRRKLERAIACPIIEWDESFSTRFARDRMFEVGLKKRARETKGTTDTWAAAIILQEYLDSHGQDAPEADPAPAPQ